MGMGQDPQAEIQGEINQLNCMLLRDLLFKELTKCKGHGDMG